MKSWMYRRGLTWLWMGAVGMLSWTAGCSDSGSGTNANDRDAASGSDASVDAARTDGGTDAGTADGGDASVPWTMPMCVWNQAYQENYEADTVADILAKARNCYVLLDPFESETARNAIPEIRQDGNIVGCYISVGTCEDWRADYSEMKQYCVSKAWGDWPGEYFVDRTDTGLEALMLQRIDKMANWGCDMVEFDNMDWAFDDDYRAEYGFQVTPGEGETYNQDLCQHARGKGMKCMAKSTTQGAEDFDGLTVESLPQEKDWWDHDDLQNILDAGRLGIIVHYNETDCQGIYDEYLGKYGNKLSFICEDRNLKKYVHFNQ